MTSFSDLPLDILHLIASQLPVPSFLALTSACRSLSDPTLAHSSAYWYDAVHSTFRVPNQPVVSTDGARWKKLYKRLLTQTRPYTWGLNDRGQLGHSYIPPHRAQAGPPAARMRRQAGARQVTWPEEMQTEGGIIADLQMGGWGTSYLTSKGCLYTAGFINDPGFGSQYSKEGVERLKYPPGWTNPGDRYEPETALASFSMGRGHILGLSDRGRIWTWWDPDKPGAQVKLLGIDLNEQGAANGRSLVKQVIAGWGKSAALIEGTGIVVWDPVRTRHRAEEEDTLLVMEHTVVPRTGFERSAVGNSKDKSPADNGHVGEVIGFIVLEHCIVFYTHLGKVFASWMSDGPLELSDPLELFPHVDEQGLPPATDEGQRLDSEFITDVQGTFRNFALFTRSGEVLNGTQDHINDWRQTPATRATSHLKSVPALQNTGVIKLAFGDYHFLALHKDGYITSYGTESQGCGCLGLGGARDPVASLRGKRNVGFAGNAKLVPHAYTTGRRVWFEPEKREWIKYLASGGYDPQESHERRLMLQQLAVQGEMSEWIEQEGNAWNEKFARPHAGEERPGEDDSSSFHYAKETPSEDDLAPYFALSITAAGWQSGALVLVNEHASAAIRESCIVHEALPGPPQVQQASPTRTSGGQEEQGILPTIRRGISWFLGLTPASDQNHQPPAEHGQPVFVNPRIRFPPHRPFPPHGLLQHRQGPASNGAGHLPGNPGQTGRQQPGPALPDAQEENFWDPEDPPHHAPPAPQPGAAPVPAPTGADRRREAAQGHHTDNASVGERRQPTRTFIDPVRQGAAPDAASRWVWAYDSFPRLRLADGREMPGRVPLTEWRSGRPEWDLGFTAYSE